MHDRDETRLHQIYGMEIPNDVRAVVDDLSKIYQRIKPGEHLTESLIAYAIHTCQQQKPVAAETSHSIPIVRQRGRPRKNPELAETT